VDPGEQGELQIDDLQSIRQQVPWAFSSNAHSDTPVKPSPHCPGRPEESDFPEAEEAELEDRPQQFVDGAYYSGQWRGDVRHGQGRLERVKWGSYEGQFVNGKATGIGFLVKVTGDMYSGEWLNDCAHGHGHYIHGDGSTYQGQWDSDMKSGHGLEQWPDGSTYEGEFVRGRKHGHGYYCACEGSYDGQFREDVMDGKGQYVFADGRVYNGDWERARMTGNGTMNWPDGKRYAGQFKDDKKWGNGVYFWPDGRAYEGQWVQGKQHGHGVYVSRKGRRCQCIWSDGKCTSWDDGASESAVSTVASSGGLCATSEAILSSMLDSDDTALLEKLETLGNFHMSERNSSPQARQDVRFRLRPCDDTQFIVDIDGRVADSSKTDRCDSNDTIAQT